MLIDKIVELYRESFVHGFPVSLSLSHLNGRESFSFTSIPGPDFFLARSTMDAASAVATATDVFPTATKGRRQEPTAPNILQRDGDDDGLANAAADVHPRRCRCNPPPFLMELRGQKQSFCSPSPNIISGLPPPRPFAPAST